MKTPVFILQLVILVGLLSSCGSKVQPDPKDRRIVTSGARKINGTSFDKPQANQRFVSGEEIPLSLTRKSDTLPLIDSIEVRISGSEPGLIYKEPYEYSLSSAGLSMGKKTISVICYYDDGRKEFHNRDITIISDIEPPLLNYRVVNTWPHDVKAYTQGLVYEDGFLFEGTGQWAESSLRKVNISTGEPERMLSLANDIFGEGIAIFGERIFQLSYKSQVGFVYEKETFKRIQKVYYENKEGWGLTHDGENLIMSDGSHMIYYMDPEYFTEVRRIEVYDHQSPISRLNELEYIDGKIFANIYGEENIVIIDPESGKVTGRMNMRGLLKPEDRHNRIDVFNGIAWDPDRRIMFVTGKYWPKLFEISLRSEF